jgi:Fe2+ or Zn2+ uptake regulation protein
MYNRNNSYYELGEEMQKKTVERRGSRQKSIVFNSVMGLFNHPTAEEVYFRAKKEIPALSLSTVYRNLRILVEEGNLNAIPASGSEVHYDHNISNHCHIRCRMCGMVRDVCFPPVNFNAILPSDASGFSVNGVCVTFTGVCRDCGEKITVKGEQK